jgi:hypothetical protein
MIHPTEWLKQFWPNTLPFTKDTIPGVEKPTNLQVVAALVMLNNGSLTVTRWGITASGGVYGRTGLNNEEAMALMNAGAYLSGLCDATGVTVENLQPLFNEEWQRVMRSTYSQAIS